ncbi:hypothetical protein BJV82DRAFT_302619 [Fennellomyces sp. T-0311]|nr:hypothetical protein BJV82DRAFT_302619 [Fennellomyces sp. T-0311]
MSHPGATRSGCVETSIATIGTVARNWQRRCLAIPLHIVTENTAEQFVIHSTGYRVSERKPPSVRVLATRAVSQPFGTTVQHNHKPSLRREGYFGKKMSRLCWARYGHEDSQNNLIQEVKGCGGQRRIQPDGVANESLSDCAAKANRLFSVSVTWSPVFYDQPC